MLMGTYLVPWTDFRVHSDPIDGSDTVLIQLEQKILGLLACDGVHDTVVLQHNTGMQCSRSLDASYV